MLHKESCIMSARCAFLLSIVIIAMCLPMYASVRGNGITISPRDDPMEENGTLFRVFSRENDGTPSENTSGQKYVFGYWVSNPSFYGPIVGGNITLSGDDAKYFDVSRSAIRGEIFYPHHIDSSVGGWSFWVRPDRSYPEEMRYAEATVRITYRSLNYGTPGVYPSSTAFLISRWIGPLIMSPGDGWGEGEMRGLVMNAQGLPVDGVYCSSSPMDIQWSNDLFWCAADGDVLTFRYHNQGWLSVVRFSGSWRVVLSPEGATFGLDHVRWEEADHFASIVDVVVGGGANDVILRSGERKTVQSADSVVIKPGFHAAYGSNLKVAIIEGVPSASTADG